MGFSKDILHLIVRDEEFGNESERISLIIRAQAVILLIHTLVLYSVFPFLGEWQSFYVGLSFVTLFAMVIVMGAKGHVKCSKILLIVTCTLYSIACMITYGYTSGSQYFLIIALELCCITFYLKFRTKLAIASFGCILFVVLNIVSGALTPLYPLFGICKIFVRIFSSILVFASLLIGLELFSSKSLNSEKKLIDYNKRILMAASIDPLTQLFNRGAVKSFLATLTKDFEDGNNVLSIGMGDIDHFKHVNDTYGHGGGDEVLKAVSATLKECMDGKGCVARWGGEEFLFVFDNINGDQAFVLLEEMRSKVKELVIPYEDKEIKVTMTFGLTEYSPCQGIEAAIEHADQRLYFGKNHGRNKVCY